MWTKTKTNSHFALTFLALSLALPATIHAQINQQNGPVNRGPIERIVEGKVVNKGGLPIGGAVVYLKNTRSNTVKTYIADDSGHFRFGELSQDTDYELWAESNGVRSKSKGISSFDNDSKFYFSLKVDAP